ncbi:RxLR-like protein [Plasmopara halstedii]|uniref:RxLR-like protein n=1 Tax=Plasmopara halstedii TaxID=4781 RepID=A0A0P1AZK6_PLAHL|nr:RxLR-like protein [Plasmopara halstedii]CEG47278.1 RxLR-like protein [Plasmopara halstedii]|eukprot:XP_024583647.1 RxLR-like protein [Plasmopara halstedii]
MLLSRAFQMLAWLTLYLNEMLAFFVREFALRDSSKVVHSFFWKPVSFLILSGDAQTSVVSHYHCT